MPHTTHHPVRIAFETEGPQGPPVLLIMGFAVPGRGWVNQVRGLEQHHRVAWFDNRGVGGSEMPRGLYRMAELAGDGLAVMDTLGWECAHIVGVSMGGMIAQHLALNHRRRVRSLTLLATHHGGLRSRLPTARGLRHFLGGLLARSPEDRLAALERLLYPASWLADSDREAVRQALRDQFGDPVHGHTKLAQLAAVARHDTRRRLHELAGLPTLIIQPTDDLLVRPVESERLHRMIPGAALLRLEETGHGLIRQRADAINQALLEHFASAERARR